MAYVIQDNTGADIFRILPKTPDLTDHNDLLQAAQKEIRRDVCPEIGGTIENSDSYDTYSLHTSEKKGTTRYE